MEAQILAKPAFTVVGIKYRGKNENREIPQLWDQFIPRLGEITHRAQPMASYGLIGNFDPSTGEVDYVAGLGVENVASMPKDMVCWHVPAGQYAVFTTKLSDNFQAFYHGIYTCWLPQSGYQHGGTPDFEYYDKHFKGGNEDPFYIYIPIKG